jgi:hypothetical protein
VTIDDDPRKMGSRESKNMVLSGANMLLQDAGTDLCSRLLSHSDNVNTGTREESGTVYNNVGFYFFGGLGLIFLFLFCIRGIWASYSGGGNGVATTVMVLPDSWPHDARPGEAIPLSSTTLAQRKQATLEIFRTSQVTMVRK